jgi:hypothetical protein
MLWLLLNFYLTKNWHINEETVIIKIDNICLKN